jgi:hypothetical protein
MYDDESGFLNVSGQVHRMRGDHDAYGYCRTCTICLLVFIVLRLITHYCTETLL